jgi:hypothetical protein
VALLGQCLASIDKEGGMEELIGGMEKLHTTMLRIQRAGKEDKVTTKKDLHIKTLPPEC